MRFQTRLGVDWEGWPGGPLEGDRTERAPTATLYHKVRGVATSGAACIKRYGTRGRAHTGTPDRLPRREAAQLVHPRTPLSK